MKDKQTTGREIKGKWKHSGEPMSEDQNKAFQWIFRILKKKPEECDDAELQAQKIYKNIVIF